MISAPPSRKETRGPRARTLEGSAPLPELMRYARLSARQAAVVVLDVGCDAYADAARTVRVTTAGTAVRVGAADGADRMLPGRRHHGTAPLVSALLAGLRAPSGPAGRDPDAAVRAALHELDERCAAGTDADARQAFDRLAAAAAPVETAARAGLGALVSERQARPTPRRTTGRAGRRLRRPLVALLAFVLLVGLEAVLLRGELTHDLGPATGGGSGPRFGGTDPPAPSSAAVAGHATAGPVRGVVLRALRPCHPGATCTVVVAVALRSTGGPVTVGWSLLVTDRCDGTRATRTGGVLHARAGAHRAAEVRRVPLPDGRDLSATAVTTSPARVSSVPLRVSTGTGCDGEGATRG